MSLQSRGPSFTRTCLQWVTINGVGGLCWVFMNVLNKSKITGREHFIRAIDEHYATVTNSNSKSNSGASNSGSGESKSFSVADSANLSNSNSSSGSVEAQRSIITLSNHACNIDDPLVWGSLLKARYFIFLSSSSSFASSLMSLFYVLSFFLPF